MKTEVAAGTCTFISHLSVNIWGSQGLKIKSLEMHKGIKGMKTNQCLERIYTLRLKFYNIEDNHFGFLNMKKLEENITAEINEMLVVTGMK